MFYCFLTSKFQQGFLSQDNILSWEEKVKLDHFAILTQWPCFSIFLQLSFSGASCQLMISFRESDYNGQDWRAPWKWKKSWKGFCCQVPVKRWNLNSSETTLAKKCTSRPNATKSIGLNEERQILTLIYKVIAEHGVGFTKCYSQSKIGSRSWSWHPICNPNLSEEKIEKQHNIYNY